MLDKFEQCLNRMPLFAVLRGIKPEEAYDVGGALVDAGVTVLEVTLNSPDPYTSIETLAKSYSDTALIGAGTVTAPDEVAQVQSAGGEIIISPNTNLDVIKESKARDLISLPGCFTPSEAMAALQAGADGLKLFPAEALLPSAVKAIRAVLPKETKVFVVGGVNANNMEDYIKVGANGFGAGSSLYKPGKEISEIAISARAVTKNLTDAMSRAKNNGA